MLPEPELETEAQLETDGAIDALPAEPKKSALARLAGGVGSLFARVAGKKERSPDQTIELATGDIMAEFPEPPPIPKPKS
jgi:hypothetical protein